MPTSSAEPLEISLESPDLVLRGFTGEELEPAILNGQLIVNLTESTNLKDLSLTFSGQAKVSWRDSSSHHHEHPLFFHDFSFLQSPGSGTASSASSTHHGHHKKDTHVHTLKAGRHVFPFSLHVPGSLPASLRTYSGTCVSEYRLKAVATRPGFAADWKAKKAVKVARGFGVDAVEYNQTLEIENTWPGKVMYAFTIPHKAFAAGDTIPVSVKFSPMAKGVRIVSLITTIREHTTVHSKNSSHSEARDATVIKYNFVEDSGSATASGHSTPAPARIESTASLSSMWNPTSGASTPSAATYHPTAHGEGFPLGQASGSNRPLPGSARFQRELHSALAGEGEDEVDEHHEAEIDDGHDTEIDVQVDVPIPVWTSPTHTVHPVFINHKIKWSAFIKNPDGHVSELRCALPIHILAQSLSEEARLASAGSRNLLFGESGVLAHSDVPQVDLPAYADHVMDRVANADTTTYFSLNSGFTPTPWSRSGGDGTPHSSPPPSRPASPGGFSRGTSSMGLSSLASQHQPPRSGRTSGSATPVSPGFVDPEHPDDHRNWADSELLGTLTLDHTSPPGSNPSSAPGSRHPSRPSSPVHDRDDHPHPGAPAYTSPALTSLSDSHGPPPPLGRSSTSSSGFFHLHIPKPLRPLTSFSRNASSSSLSALNNHHPSVSALTSALEAHASRGERHNSHHHHPLETITHGAVSNSPMGSSAHPLSNNTSPLSSSPATTSSSHFPVGSVGSGAGDSGTTSPAHPHYPSRRHTEDLFHGNGHSSGTSTPLNPDEVDLLSQVPSYDVAARGFLGGGAPPLSLTSNLPDYS